MRKTIAAVTAALIVLGGAPLPAWAAAGPEAPTDLQVSWADAATGSLKVTWTDGGEANKVRVEYEDTDPPLLLATVKAGDPNGLTLPSTRLYGNRVARIVVVTRDEAGVESDAIRSAWFDTNRPAEANLLTAAALADGSVQLSWYREQAPQDTTPNDLLDRTSTDEHVVPAITSRPGPDEEFPVPTEAKTAAVPARPRPYRVEVSTRNEWGVSTDTYSAVRVTTLTTSLAVPATAQYLSTIRFTAGVGSPECSAVRCGYGPVYLQARADTTKPWATIGTYGGGGPKFAGDIGVYGGRQYRLYVPAWKYHTGGDIAVAPPISTSARYSAAQAKFAVVGFNTATAKVGQVVKTTVSILPAGTVKASLQWYDGKAWHHSTYIPLSKGKGTFSFKAAGRGTTRYWRVTVPKMTMNGLPILATPSRSFKLAVL